MKFMGLGVIYRNLLEKIDKIFPNQRTKYKIEENFLDELISHAIKCGYHDGLKYLDWRARRIYDLGVSILRTEDNYFHIINTKIDNIKILIEAKEAKLKIENGE